MNRALGVIRLSKSADPVSTSIDAQRDIIDAYAEREGLTIVGYAEDPAVSAFKIPPHKRRVIAAWLDRPEDFDCLVYCRQDRYVRRVVDFFGTVLWCREHGKPLLSATENFGDVTQHAGLMLGFIAAWEAEAESQANAERTGIAQARLAIQGRWRGGRPAFGLAGVPNPDGPGVVLAPDPETAPLVAKAALSVIAGDSPNAVIAEWNRSGVLAADGGSWKAETLRSILRNRALLDYGVIPVDDWGPLQAALDARSVSRRVRTTGSDYLALDLVFCGACGGKVYRWRHTTNGRFYGRCRNELKRAEAETPCLTAMIPYAVLESLVADDIARHGQDVIEIRATDARVKARLDDLGREVIRLSEDFAARTVARSDYLARQSVLLDALQATESGAGWLPSGETVADRYARLTPAERRLWLLRAGASWRVYRADAEGSRRWRVEGSWRDDGRERVRPPSLPGR